MIQMREFEFQVAAMHRENDELRMQLDQKSQEVNVLLLEKQRFTLEQEVRAFCTSSATSTLSSHVARVIFH